MLYAISLRAIGQSLEMLRLQTFSLEKKGELYMVRSDSLTATHHWILRNNLAGNLSNSPLPDPKSTELTLGDGSLCYGPLDIARLNAQKRKTRGNHGFEQAEGHRLSRLLRTLGEHLDRKEASALKISWTADSALVEYQTPDGLCEHKDFTVEELHQLALHSKFRRSRRSASIGSR
jgi:hypothetical protein